MKMDSYISEFANQLNHAIEIGDSSFLNKQDGNTNINNILICGLGGSGIGGTIIKDIFSEEIKIPIVETKDYNIPNFVGKKTLAIVCSYSGNTEETISALRKCLFKEAEIIIITSGGEMKKIAIENNIKYTLIPSGHPPRAMFAYSFTQIFYVLYHYKMINESFKDDFSNSIKMICDEEKNIKKESKEVAKKIYNHIPIIYVAQGFEGVAIRFRQQINENSKTLCWHHVVPEMNHNELLAWRESGHKFSVVYFRNKLDFERNQIRIEINKELISKHASNITEIWSKGSSRIENTLYHVNFGDWISWHLSELNNVDAIEIGTINFLKSELSKI